MSSPAHVLTAGLDATMQQRISTWFNTFNFLPPLPLVKAKIDHLSGAQATLEGVMQAMIASNFDTFILIIHGYSDGVGLVLKLANDQYSRRPHTTYDDLQRLMDDDAKHAGASREDLRHMNVAGRDVPRLIDLRRQLVQKKIDTIEFRSCNLGRNPIALDVFRRFFGARVAGAPDIFTLFGLVDTFTTTQMLKDHARFHRGDGRWVTYNFPFAARAPDLVVCFALNGESKPEFGGHIAAADPRVLDAWIKKFVKSDGVFRGSPMPVHGLWAGDIEVVDSPKHSHLVPEAVIVQKEELDSPLGGFGPSDLSGARLVPTTSDNYAKHIIYAH
jgi:hypothetical protein